MRDKFIIACVTVIIFSISLCTLVGCNTTKESTDRLEKAINKSNNTNNEDDKDNGGATIINNYNGNYYDNSITTNNNTTNNYNTDTDDDNDNIVSNNSKNEEDYRKYNEYNAESNSSNNNDTIIPLGDERNDTLANPSLVHIENVKCPECGAYSFMESYIKTNTGIKNYMGMCSSCYYEK